MQIRLPAPPFNLNAAHKKIKMLEDDLNLRCPQRIVLAYANDAKWLIGDTTLQGQQDIVEYLSVKLLPLSNFTSIKVMRVYISKRILVDFSYSYQDLSGNWQHAEGWESFVFNNAGKIKQQTTKLISKDHIQKNYPSTKLRHHRTDHFSQ